MVKVKEYFYIHILYRENARFIYTGGSLKVRARKLSGSLDTEGFYRGNGAIR
jgi:hypothetical protein